MLYFYVALNFFAIGSSSDKTFPNDGSPIANKYLFIESVKYFIPAGSRKQLDPIHT